MSVIEGDVVDLLDIPMEDIEEVNELDEYLLKLLEKVCDPIAWWWDHQMSYPRLSKMALDYLSIPHESFQLDCICLSNLTMQSVPMFPATSTAMEQIFSQGWQLLKFTHNCLSGNLIHSLLCLSNWCQKDLGDTSHIFRPIRCSNRKQK